jgi:hypothetical protein
MGTFTTTIPPGSFTKQLDGSFTFVGVVNGVSLNVVIQQAVTLQYRFNAKGDGRELDRDQEPGVCDPEHRPAAAAARLRSRPRFKAKLPR